MGPTTTVQTVVTDYEGSLRNAAHAVFPEANLIGCDVHFQRAVAQWAYKAGAYSAKASPTASIAVRRAMALCFLPQHFIEMGIQVIEAEVGDTTFGKKFVNYLRTTWLRVTISVYSERLRTTNGCETFHWRIQRVHDCMNNNINQFIERLRSIESMCAISIRQFHKCLQSKKQQLVEKMHRSIEDIFELKCGRLPDADRVRNFLDCTLHFADKIHKHYQAQKVNKSKDSSGLDLLIASKETSRTNKKPSKANSVTVTVLFNPHEEIYKKRTVMLKSDDEIRVRRQYDKVVSTKHNVVIADPSLSLLHASMSLTKEGELEIRDDGSEHGTYINDRRLSFCGVTSPCFTLTTEDVVAFGTVTFTIQIIAVAAPTSSVPATPTEVSEVTFRTISGDKIPERNLRLTENVATIIGKATQNKPALRANAYYPLAQIGPKHAHIVWTGTTYFLKSVSPKILCYKQ